MAEVHGLRGVKGSGRFTDTGTCLTLETIVRLYMRETLHSQ